MTFHLFRSAKLFLLPYFPYIAVAMICFAIFCSHRQYQLGADLTKKTVNKKYVLTPIKVLWLTSFFVVYILALDHISFRDDRLYSLEFFNGGVANPLTNLLDTITLEAAISALMLYAYFVCLSFICFGLVWLIFYMVCFPPSDPSDPVESKCWEDKCKNWDYVQDIVANKPALKRYYIMDTRKAIFPTLNALGLILSIGISFSMASSLRDVYKYYTTDLQLSQVELSALQEDCGLSSALYSNGEISCGTDTVFQVGSYGRSYDAVVVWSNEDKTKHEILIKIPTVKAPPQVMPDKARKMVRDNLNHINNEYLNSRMTSEKRSAWKALEK